MIVSYLFASPLGDIPLSAPDLNRPFILAPHKAHPHLTLLDYFDTLKTSLLEDRGELLNQAFKGSLGYPLKLEDVQELRIRSEKHGVLYHLVSVEIVTKGRSAKFTLSTAMTENSVECMRGEHDILRGLNRDFGHPYLPEIFGFRNMNCRTATGKTVEMVILASRWFLDYHEWHMATDPKDNVQKIQIWDYGKGPWYASDVVASGIIRNCARILTLYYDFRNFMQISAWHHAAGDFIVKINPHGKPHVRLTTVRQYGPLMPGLTEEGVNPAIALIYFFLDTTVKMRLDRLEGVGETVWLGDFAVTATANGFFEALRARESANDLGSGLSADTVLSLMKSFDREELKRVFEPLLAHYAEHDSNDMDLIDAHIADHIRFLYQTLREGVNEN